MGVVYRLGRERVNTLPKLVILRGLRQREIRKLIRSPNSIAESFYFDIEVLHYFQKHWNASRLYHLLSIPQSEGKMSKRLGGIIIGCRD